MAKVIKANPVETQPKKVAPKSDEKFMVINVRTKEPRSSNGVPMLWSSGEEAAAEAKYLTELFGEKWQPRKATLDKNWRKREAARFEDGTYTPVPWANEPWAKVSPDVREHYAHLSKDKELMVAYTSKPAAGELDKQHRLSVGSYLNKFYLERGYISSEHYFKLLTQIAVDFEGVTYQLAKTSKDIVEIYRKRGVSSCMTHRADQYLCSPHHPVEAYGGPDLALAYIQRKDIYGDKYLTARAIVWPDRKIYARAYGEDSGKLTYLLDKEGYHNGSLEGARLQRIPVPASPTRGIPQNAFVCPYLDSVGVVHDDGKYLIITAAGEMGTGTSGIATDNRTECAECHTLYNRDGQTVWNHAGNDLEQVCLSCFKKITCESFGMRDTHGRRGRREDMILPEDAEWAVHKRRLDLNESPYAICSRDHLLLDRNNGENVEMFNGDIVSRLWFKEHGRRCQEGFNMPKEDPKPCEWCSCSLAKKKAKAEVKAEPAQVANAYTAYSDTTQQANIYNTTMPDGSTSTPVPGIGYILGGNLGGRR